MRWIDDIPVCGDPIDEQALEQIRRTRAVCDGAALMADHHKGYGVPIGGVMVSERLISPTAVGYDIACGNKAVRTDAPAEEVKARIGEIMDRIAGEIPFGIGRTSVEPIDHPLFESPLWEELEVLRLEKKGKPLRDLAREQLGTVGSGNHYVDLFEGDDEAIWIGVHFGSRGLGHTIASWFLRQAGASDAMDAQPTLLEQDSDLGEQYIRAMGLAGEYAYAGRDEVCDRVRRILGAHETDSVHNHHNFAWRETIDGRDFWVCRKGATPAYPGQRGFVGGSMGEASVILEGVDAPESRALYYSTVHGAGRVMSRSAATGRSPWGKKKREGLISREAMDEWVRGAGVELRGADVDEAPQAYKRLHEVLEHQGDTIRVLHWLRPIGVAMAGHDIVDPYKD